MAKILPSSMILLTVCIMRYILEPFHTIILFYIDGITMIDSIIDGITKPMS